MSNKHSLIANTGIQILTFPLHIDTQDKFKLWYHEWYDTANGEWRLEPVYELRGEGESIYYNKQKLYRGGYLSDPTIELDPNDLKNDGITPLRVDDVNCPGVKGEIFCMRFGDRENRLSSFENVWLPLPYFFKKTERRFKFGPLNWARAKLIPQGVAGGVRKYQVLLAFDTRAEYEGGDAGECPVFPDAFRQAMDFALCSNEFYVMDYCSPGKEWSYVDEYLLRLAHPTVSRVSQIKGANAHKMSYVASYMFLIGYLAQKNLMPAVRLYKDTDVETKDVDMVVDIGNSRTTALLIEDNHNFNQMRQLELTDYTRLVRDVEGGLEVNTHGGPFDMRLAFRRVEFGDFGMKDSLQFVHPSLVRLGEEANTLIHLAASSEGGVETLSTYSSPKRYLWDWHPSREEWRFLVLEGEKDNHILYLRGITNQLKSDGRIDPSGHSGTSFHYSRRSLMTFAFLEMIVQARTQLNGERHRSNHAGLGRPSMPRKLRRLIVTCPTAMSRVEREELVRCAKDAVILLENFECKVPRQNQRPGSGVEVIPAPDGRTDTDSAWYYDEATCAQLVYMYGEVGYKYKGCCNEFFKLYGKKEPGESQETITVGSVDIGAGTTDLMVCKYAYTKGDVTTLTPDPQFYDSYYYAGDDMLYALVKNVMLLGESSAFRGELKGLPAMAYRQRIKDFFGNDHNLQTAADRMLRRDFCIQYCTPLMCHFLELLANGAKDCLVEYGDVFASCPPSPSVTEGFRSKMGIDVAKLQWRFRREEVSEVVRKEFEPLLKKIATIMHSCACDIVLLSGRPASLPVIREIFLKYYAVPPGRLILLNDYYVGDWYPFGDNTGYIKNPKTIVAMGGVIGHYASDLSNLDRFVVSLNKLNQNLKSTVNYVEASREGLPISYFITPQQRVGEITVSSFPAILNVRQIGMDAYPSRPLYCIDFNADKIADRIRRRAALAGEDYPTDAKVMGQVKEVVDKLKTRMPFRLTIERDAEDKELLTISAITDKHGNEVTDSNLELNIQSMGIADSYWLDSGAFSF